MFTNKLFFNLFTSILFFCLLFSCNSDKFTLPKDNPVQFIIQQTYKGSIDSAFIGDKEQMNRIIRIINDNHKKTKKFDAPNHIILRYYGNLGKATYVDIAFNEHDISINGDYYYTNENLGDTIKQMIAMQNSLEHKEQTEFVKKQDILRNSFLSDAKLHPTVKYYIQDTNATVLLEQLNDSIEFKVLGDINSDGKIDSVFLMAELFDGNYGQSFTFTDTHLSRIQTDVQCNHLDNLFVIDDIDEDGIKEIGLYYSSCASRYKALRVYSFKSGHWQEFGEVIFDLNYIKPPMQKRIKKIGKGKFAMREITDTGTPDSMTIQDKWLNFEIK